MNNTALDLSRQLNIYCRINRASTKTFTVLDENSAAYSLIYEDFYLFIKKNSGEIDNVIYLEVGSGITLSSNQIVIDITATQSNIDEGQYYWELVNVNDTATWLNGYAYFHNGVFDGVTNDAESLQIVEDSVIQLIVR